MRNRHTKVRSAFTLVEMVLVVGMMAVISLAMVGMVRATHENWQTVSNHSAALLDGQAVTQQMVRILRQAKAVTAVSESTDEAGYITFTGVNDTTEEFRLDTTTGELLYGDPNALQVLAAPVSSLVFECYDAGLVLLAGPLDAEDTEDIRTVAFEATFVNPDDGTLAVTLAGRIFIPTSAAVTEPSGDVLFVAVDAASLTAQETARKTLIESWGYTVSLISDDASQAVFDTAVADADVVYVSEQVSNSALGNKLTGATIGVVIEEGDAVSNFEMVSANPTDVTLMMASIVDNTHYITSPFNLEDVTLSNSGQPFTYFTAGLAAGVEVLGQVFNKSSLMVADVGAELIGGANAAGRRVKLPWGGSGFDFNAVNADGRTIMQRSLEWAAEANLRPIAHWKLDETSGTTATDSSGRGNHGTLAGGPVWTVGLLDGVLALDDFSNDRVVVPDDPSLDITDAITLAAWIKPNELGSQFIISKALFGVTDGYELSLNANTGAVFFRLNQQSQANTYRIQSTSIHPTDGITWMHIAATYDGETQRLYINGVEENSQPASISINANTIDLGLGGQADGTRVLDGVIDDVRVYDGALSAAEISDLFTAGSGGGSDLEMYVNDITMAWRKQGPRYYGQATVWVKDENGDDVEGATVSGTWSASVSGTDSGDTAADGTVMHESSGVNGGGTYIFTVDSITKDGFTYNAALDVESSGMIVAP